MIEDSSTCLLCGEPAELSIHDIWTDGNFQLSTCCAGLLEEVSADIDADPAWGRALLRHLGAEELTGHALRRAASATVRAAVPCSTSSCAWRRSPFQPPVPSSLATIDTAVRRMRGGSAQPY